LIAIPPTEKPIAVLTNATEQDSKLAVCHIEDSEFGVQTFSLTLSLLFDQLAF
jgi:hypothetical protein